MITVRFPSVLRGRPASSVEIAEPVSTLGELLDLLDGRFPGLRVRLDDPIFNFAVNGDMVLHGVRGRVLRDGDVVEVVPAISGG